MQPQMQQVPQQHKWLAIIRSIGFFALLLILLIGGIFWIVKSLGSWTILLSTAFTVLTAIFGLFQIISLFFPKRDTIPSPSPISVTPQPAQPSIVINVPPYPAPVTPTPPIAPMPQTPASTDMYIGTRATPPTTDPRTIQQREPVVKEVYAQLTQLHTTAVVLIGIGGMGKSTLAALVYKYAEAQRVAGKGPFQAEAIWLRVEQNTTFVGLAGNLFATLGRPQPNLGQLTPANAAFALVNLLTSVDAPRLIVLDQFENFLNWETGHALPEHLGVGELLDALNSQECRCRVLLTSRPRPKGTRAVPPTCLQVYPVNGLTLTEGVNLLRNRDVTGSESELQTAVQRCDGHGLALELLASIISEQKLPFSTLLKDEQLWDGDIATNLLDAIYQNQLSDLQRQLLRAFSVYREAVPQEAVQEMLSKSVQGQILPALRALLTQSLLQAAGEGRYQLHPIVGRYAHRHFIENDEHKNQEALHAAHAKAAQYYLKQAKTGCPPREKRRGVEDVTPLIEAVWQWCQAGQWQTAYELMERESLFADLRRWGGNVLLLDLCQQLLTEQWQPEPQQTALICSYLAVAYNTLGQKQESLGYFEQALRIFKEVGDHDGEARMLNNLGLVYDALGKKQKSLGYFEQTLHILKEVGDRSLEGTTLNNLGLMYYTLGQKQEALGYFEQALHILKEVGDRGGEGVTLTNLGHVYDDLEQKQEALGYFEQALLILKEVGEREKEGVTLNNLGRVYNALGQKQEALGYYQQALLIRREVGDRGGEGVTLNNLGRVYDDLGQKQEALHYYRDALSLHRAVRNFMGEGVTLHNVGMIYGAQHLDVALACFLLAKSLFEQVQSPNRSIVEQWIDGMHDSVGEQQFAALLARVEPQAQQIVDAALGELK